VRDIRALKVDRSGLNNGFLPFLTMSERRPLEFRQNRRLRERALDKNGVAQRDVWEKMGAGNSVMMVVAKCSFD
jgi:hypothetical protein